MVQQFDHDSWGCGIGSLALVTGNSGISFHVEPTSIAESQDLNTDFLDSIDENSNTHKNKIENNKN